MFAMTIAFGLMIALSVQPKDILVASRYTGFGETNYYRDRWYYLYTFVVFALTVTVVHSSIMVKLFAIGKRIGAFFVGWIAIFLLIIAFAYAHQVLVTAFL